MVPQGVWDLMVPRASNGHQRLLFLLPGPQLMNSLKSQKYTGYFFRTKLEVEQWGRIEGINTLSCWIPLSCMTAPRRKRIRGCTCLIKHSLYGYQLICITKRVYTGLDLFSPVFPLAHADQPKWDHWGVKVWSIYREQIPVSLPTLSDKARVLWLGT